MEKDIPFLQRVMPKKFTAAYMKGRSNYACLNRIYKAEDQPFLEGLHEIDYFEEIRHWSARLTDRRPCRAQKSARKSFVLEPHQRSLGDMSRAKMSRL